MTHFHDADFKKALSELAPEEKSNIEEMKFGEIKNRYGTQHPLHRHKLIEHLALRKAFARTWLFSKLPRSSKRRLKLLDSPTISRLVFLLKSLMERRAKGSCDDCSDLL